MQETNAETPTVICFTCNQPGHKSYRCPEKKTQTKAQASDSTSKTPHTTDRARLAHITEEEARDAPDIVIGKYLIALTPWFCLTQELLAPMFLLSLLHRMHSR